MKNATIIAAVSLDGVIGIGEKIPWNCPEDMKHFRNTTKGAALIMGRLTYGSIGRPLPGRQTIIITHNPTYKPIAEGVYIARTIDEALAQVDADRQPFIAGGGQIYQLALEHPQVNRAIISTIPIKVLESHPDAENIIYFPTFLEKDGWNVTQSEHKETFRLEKWEREH